MSDNNAVIIEQNQRFSQSALYDFMRDYFDQQGVDAWVNQVPFYVTCNPFIANCYAHLFIQMVRNWVRLHPEAKQHPFYVMELGTGSGKFSFHALKKIFELRRDLQMEDIRICYIMSDFTKNNVKYWKTHPVFQPYLAAKQLDFAVYNMENDDPITLLEQNLTLTPEHFVNPLTVFANYIFDTVTQDAFIVNQGNLQELRVTLSAEPDNMQNGKPLVWEQVQLNYQPHAINGAYYDDEIFNNILNDYKTLFKDTSFLMPFGGLKAMRKLHQLTNNKLFLISSDKGYSSLDSMENLAHPQPAFHGSFSMMVNFHAIAQYFKYRGGDSVLQSTRRGIKTIVCCNGFQFNEMPDTALAIKQHVEDLSPAEYFALHRRVSDGYQEYDLEALSAHLMLADWDPQIFMRVNNRLCALMEESDLSIVEFLANNMHRVWEHFYAMPKADNLAFEIGLFFHNAKRYSQAMHYYEIAKEQMNEQFSVIYNMALCNYYLDKIPDARAGFKHALELDPNSKEAKEWSDFLVPSSKPARG